jgi:hypothetical protein
MPTEIWMDNVDDRLKAIEDRLTRGSERMDLMDQAIAKNTEITQAIHDILAAGRVGLKVLGGLGLIAKWIGMLAAAGVAIYSAFYAATHGGVPPK